MMNNNELQAVGRVMQTMRAELQAAIAISVSNRAAIFEETSAQALARIAESLTEGRKLLDEIELQVRARGEAAAMELEHAGSEIREQADAAIAVLLALVKRAETTIAMLQHGRDGRDGRDGLDGRHGVFSPAIPWEAGRAYAAVELVNHRGGLWQARFNAMSEEPGTGPAWVPIAAGLESITAEMRGRELTLVSRMSDGRESRTAFRLPIPLHLGGWLAERTYERGDEVAHKSSSWRAQVDGLKGVEPGDGDSWLLVAKRGSTGRTGDRGPVGERGLAGPRGEPGEQGERGPAGILGRWAGQWRSGAGYVGGDVVRHANALWLAEGTTTATPGTDETAWIYML